METSWVTDDGRVTIPKAVREQSGIGPGSEVEFRRAADGSVVIARPAIATASEPGSDRFDRVRGIAGAGHSTDEILADLRGD